MRQIHRSKLIKNNQLLSQTISIPCQFTDTKISTQQQVDIIKISLIDLSINVALEAHNCQLRKDSKLPYIYHCFDVTKRALSYDEEFEKTSYEEFGAACNLHDTLEDTKLTDDKITTLFGDKVTSIVKELTMPSDVKGLRQKYDYLKSFYKKSKEATVIKISDRVCNVLDFSLNTNTAWYAIQYALLGSPIFRAYIEKDGKANPKIVQDISQMDQLIRKRFNVSLFTSSEEEIEKELFQ